MKKILLMAWILAITTSAYAAEIKPYVGFGIGSSSLISSIKTDYTKSSNTTFYSDNFTLLKLKGGIILDNAHRFSLEYDPELAQNITIHNVLIDYDYFYATYDYSKFYIGAHLGTSSFKLKNVSEFDNTTMIYGAQTGFLYDISKDLEFELGILFSGYGSDKKVNYTENGSALTLAYNFSTKVFFGLNYKF